MRTKIEFTKIEYNDDVQEGDIIVVPHERGVKRRVLHLAPRTWSKLGLRVRRTNTKTVEAMFNNPVQTVLCVVTEVRRMYCPDAAVISSVSNKVGARGDSKRPIRAVRIAPLASTESAFIYENELRKIVETGVTYGMLLDVGLPELMTISKDHIEPNIPSIMYFRNQPHDLEAPLDADNNLSVFHHIIRDLSEYIPDSLLADACFLTSLKARGASIIRPVNDSTRTFIAKMIIKHKGTEVDKSIVNSSSIALAHISKLRKELAHLRNIRKDWKRFYTRTDPVSEASKAVAKATGIKKEDVIWN